MSFVCFCFKRKLESLAPLPSFLAVNDTKRKQKVLGPNQKLKFNPTELIIYCKDFRIVRFRFDEAGPESAKKVSGLEYLVSKSRAEGSVGTKEMFLQTLNGRKKNPLIK